MWPSLAAPPIMSSVGERAAARWNGATMAEGSIVVDAVGGLLGAIATSANRHNLPQLESTRDTLAALDPLPKNMNVQLDRVYTSHMTRNWLTHRDVHEESAERGTPAPLMASER